MHQWYSRTDDGRDCLDVQGGGKSSEDFAEVQSVDSVTLVRAVLNAGFWERLKLSPFNLMFSQKPFSVFSALVAHGKDE